MPCRQMVSRCSAARALLALGLLLGSVPWATAQNPSPRGRFWRQYNFHFPFSVDRNDRSISEVELYYSLDGGPWTLVDRAKPQRLGFDVRLSRDGRYAFAIRTIYSDHRALPERLENLQAVEHLTVDATPPSVGMKVLPTRPLHTGEIAVGVQWDIRDDYLDAATVRLEGRSPGSAQWLPMTNRPLSARGEQVWRLNSEERLEVRLTARDRAGNLGEATALLGRGVGMITGGTATDGGAGRAVPRNAGFRLVRSKDITLNFGIRDKGPSGVGSIELWVTRNRQDWKKVEPSPRAPDDNAETASVSFQADSDGVYGLTVIVRSRAKLGPPDPRPGDEPQIWIEVDSTRPEAEFVDVKFTYPNDARSLTVTWKATDKNLDPQAVILEYAESENGEWKMLADGLATGANGLGRHTVATPSIKSYLLWLRMRVVDRAGNQAMVAYKEPINIDLSRPSAEIIDIREGK